MNERESALFRQRYSHISNKERGTLATIKSKQKEEIMDDYNKKFASKFVPGIHKLNFSFQKMSVC